MSNTIFQVQLKNAYLKENGIANYLKGENLISANLIYPREGVKSIESIVKLKIEDDKVFNLDEIPFEQKLLFKESIQGETQIIIKVTLLEKEDKAKKIISKLIETGIIASVGVVGAGAAIATAVVKTSVSSIFELAKVKDKITVIGEGRFPISMNTEEGEIKIQLTTPKKISLFNKSVNSDGDITLLKRTIPKGYGVGHVTLGVKKIYTAPRV